MRIGTRRTCLILGLLSLASSACNCGDEAQLGRVVPRMVVSPTALAFGEVPLGATKRLFVDVKNEGTAQLVIQAIDASAPFGVTAASMTVVPGATVLLDVSFRPVNDERATAVLVISGNDPETPMATVELSGVGGQGFLSVLPDQIDFSATSVGASRSAELVLSNIGIDAVEGVIVTDGFPRPEHYALSSLARFDELGPFGVDARSEVVMELAYRPFELGQDDGRIVFEICGERCGLEVKVVASGSESVVRLRPPVLEFGRVGIGETRTQQIVLENLGDQPVEVIEVTTAGAPEIVAAATRVLPATLAGGGSLGINVELTPVAATEIVGAVLVRTTDPVVPLARAGVTGQGEGPLFVVQPQEVRFGIERQPGSYRRALLMVNAGSSDVRVLSVSISGAPQLGLSDVPGLPARLASGESLVVNATFNPTAVGEYMGTIVIETDDPSAARVEVPVIAGMADQVCVVEVLPGRVNFGLLPPGFSRTRSAEVRNVGVDDCNLISGAMRAPVDPAITAIATTYPTTLSPGQTTQVDFRFSPTIMSEAKGNYTILTDDPVFPERHITVVGTSNGYVDLFTRPQSVDFGAVMPGCFTRPQMVSLFNGGTADAYVDAVTLTGAPNEFSVRPNFSVPARLPGGGVLTFEVGYTPTDLGTDVADVELAIRDLPFAVVVPLTGSGVANPRISQQFQQRTNNKVDVLFVIDDSCSMRDDQAALAQNFRAFIQQADVRRIDFHLGITTTTVQPLAGLLRGPVLTRTTSNIENSFSTQANVGTNGSGFEQGLEGMLGALQAAQRGVQPNAGFFRPDAGLVVIIVSDEDDQSPASPVVYLNELRNRTPVGFGTAVVSGQATGCQNTVNGSASSAPRYEEFVALTGGISESICANWANTLSNIGNYAFGLRTVFRLQTGVDTTQPLTVTVNGVAQPASGWSYDAATNSVIFTQPPPEGSTVVIEYTPVC